MVIFKSSVLSYSFKLRGIDTDYLCELPKLASLKKSLFSVHVFWSIQHPNFPTFKFKFSVLCYTYTRARHATCFAWLHNKTGNSRAAWWDRRWIIPPARVALRFESRRSFSPPNSLKIKIWGVKMKFVGVIFLWLCKVTKITIKHTWAAPPHIYRGKVYVYRYYYVNCDWW